MSSFTGPEIASLIDAGLILSPDASPDPTTLIDAGCVIGAHQVFSEELAKQMVDMPALQQETASRNPSLAHLVMPELLGLSAVTRTLILALTLDPKQEMCSCRPNPASMLGVQEMCSYRHWIRGVYLITKAEHEPKARSASKHVYHQGGRGRWHGHGASGEPGGAARSWGEGEA